MLIQIKTKERTIKPEEALLEFLREETRPKISKELRGRAELERFILPGSNIHKFYFTPPQEPEILEDLLMTTSAIWRIT